MEQKLQTAGIQQSVESLLAEDSNIQVTVTDTELDTNSPSDDTTIQDAMISPDTESVMSRNASPDKKLDNAAVARGSCSNSIVSTDSLVSETLDSKSFVVKNSESEIGKNIYAN